MTIPLTKVPFFQIFHSGIATASGDTFIATNKIAAASPRRRHTASGKRFAVIAFAGAVTMMPGLQIYRALSGTLRLARVQAGIALPSITGTLGYAFQAGLVVMRL